MIIIIDYIMFIVYTYSKSVCVMCLHVFFEKQYSSVSLCSSWLAYDVADGSSLLSTGREWQKRVRPTTKLTRKPSRIELGGWEWWESHRKSSSFFHCSQKTVWYLILWWPVPFLNIVSGDICCKCVSQKFIRPGRKEQGRSQSNCESCHSVALSLNPRNQRPWWWPTEELTRGHFYHFPNDFKQFHHWQLI